MHGFNFTWTGAWNDPPANHVLNLPYNTRKEMQSGHVKMLEVFGSDLTVVNAARVSFAKETANIGPRDENLIKYLANHNHISPFFHPQIRFRLKMPIFIAREWYRHTVGFSRNEVSRRYVNDPPECWVPSPEDIRERDTNKKQGSKDTAIKDAEEIHTILKETTTILEDVYDKLLVAGVAPEIARVILPQSMYTEFIETGSLYGYARLCSLRQDPQAQKEIRDYANAVSEALSAAFPYSWAALTGSTPKSSYP